MDKTYILSDVVYGHCVGQIVKHYWTYDEQDNEMVVKTYDQYTYKHHMSTYRPNINIEPNFSHVDVQFMVTFTVYGSYIWATPLNKSHHEKANICFIMERFTILKLKLCLLENGR